MRNLHAWLLTVPFLWTAVAAGDPAPAETPAPDPAIAALLAQKQLPESCGAIAAGVLAGKDGEVQPRTVHGLTLPTVTTKVSPTFPEAAVKAGGMVQLNAVVCKDGSVHAVQVVKAPTPAAGTAAADALRQWKFSPAEKDGQPVAVRYSVNVSVKP